MNSKLVVDSWKRSYEITGEAQSDAWDTTIGDNRIWLMDMGRPPGWMRPGTAEQRAFGFSLTDETENLVFATHRSPFAWNPGPPLLTRVEKYLFIMTPSTEGLSVITVPLEGKLSRFGGLKLIIISK